MNDDDVKRIWNENAAGWIAGVQGGYDTYRDLINNPAFFAELGNVKGLRILDVGCGEGYNTRKLAELGAVITGVDISDKLVESARYLENEKPIGIQYHICSASEMSEHVSGPFDISVSFMAMMDLLDYDRAVCEVASLVKTGGRFMFSILHPNMTSSLGFIFDDHGSRIGYKVGDYFGFNSRQDFDKWYFSHAPKELKAKHSLINGCYFKRTISEYVNTLIQCGFTVEKMWEPYADDAAIEKHPDMAVTRQVPFFLGISCTKK